MSCFDYDLDKIFEDALSNPEYHEFSDKYKKRRKKIMNENTGNKRKTKKITVSFIVIAAAAVMIPVGAYAYSMLTADIEQTGKYQNTVTINSPDESSDEFEFMEFKFGYLPKGLELMDEDSPYGGKYKNANGGGMTPVFNYVYTYDFKEELPFSASSEKYETDKATIIINYRVSYDPQVASTDNFGREVFVIMKEQPYIANLYFTDNISEDDVKKVAESLNLVPADELLYSMYIPCDEDDTNSKTSTADEEENKIQFDTIYAVGETFDLNYNEGISAKISNVNYADNYDGITTDGAGFDCDYSDFAGSLEDNIRTYIKQGDGVNTIDEVIKEENVPLQIVSLEIEYTNNLDIQQDICVCPKIFVNVNDEFIQPMDSLEYWLSDSMAYPDDSGSHFAFESSSDASKNYVIVNPGETETAKLYFIVEKENADKLYFVEAYNVTTAVKLG